MPMSLIGTTRKRSAAQVNSAYRGAADLVPGHFIFNLGHGILPQTPIQHVEQMLKRIRG